MNGDSELYIAPTDGSLPASQLSTGIFSHSNLTWAPNSDGLFFRYVDYDKNPWYSTNLDASIVQNLNTQVQSSYSSVQSLGDSLIGLPPPLGSVYAGSSNVLDLLSNDMDPNGDPLSITQINGQAVTVGQAINLTYGSLTVNADGTVTYNPFETSQNQLETFTYTISDPFGGTDTATVNLNIGALNQAPTAANDNFTTSEDTPLKISTSSVFANDLDPEGAKLSIHTFESTTTFGGKIVLSPNGQTFFYTPTTNFNNNGLNGSNAPDGTVLDSFKYTVSDGAGGYSEATIYINVTPVNNAPKAYDDMNSQLVFSEGNKIYVSDPFDLNTKVEIGEGKMPVWSPDGTRVAFVTMDGDVAYMNADGSNITIVADAESNQKSYTYQSPIYNSSNVLVGWESKTGYNTPQYSDVAWSPDGEKLAYTQSFRIY